MWRVESTAGMYWSRIREIRLEVATACGLDLGTTVISATVSCASAITGLTEATSGLPTSIASSALMTALSFSP